MRGLPKLSRNVWVLSWTSFLRDIASEMMIYLVPLFLANVLGVRTVLIGLIEGVAETTASLLKIYSGWLSDRLGRRKGLTAGGYGLSALAVPLLLVAASWPMVLLYRFLDRVGKGVRTAPRDALIAESVPSDRLGVAFGLHRAADTAGATLGILGAIALVWWHESNRVELTAVTFHAVVLWALVPAALAAIVVALGVREAGRGGHKQRPELGFAGLGVGFKRLLAVMVLFTLGNSADVFLVLRAQNLGVSLVGVLGMLALFNLIYTLCSTPAGAWSDRFGRRRMLVAGWSVYALVYLGFGLADRSWYLVLLFAAYGIYYAATNGVSKAYVADLVPDSEMRGRAYGVYHAAVGLAAMPASLMAGALWQGIGSWAGFGPSAPFYFGAAMSLLAAGLLWVWVPRVSAGDK